MQYTADNGDCPSTCLEKKLRILTKASLEPMLGCYSVGIESRRRGWARSEVMNGMINRVVFCEHGCNAHAKTVKSV